MINELENFKKRLLYRASYRGTKEMDILLGKFVNKYINDFNEGYLKELEDFLNFDDDIILDYYQNKVVQKKIDENKISKLFIDFKI